MSAEAAGVEWKLRAERSVARIFHENTSGRRPKLTFPPPKSEGVT